jgi:hypothetical protein
MRGRPRSGDRDLARYVVDKKLKELIPAGSHDGPALSDVELDRVARANGVPTAEATRSMWRRLDRKAKAVLVHDDTIAIIRQRWPHMPVSEAVNNLLVSALAAPPDE